MRPALTIRAKLANVVEVIQTRVILEGTTATTSLIFPSLPYPSHFGLSEVQLPRLLLVASLNLSLSRSRRSRNPRIQLPPPRRSREIVLRITREAIRPCRCDPVKAPRMLTPSRSAPGEPPRSRVLHCFSRAEFRLCLGRGGGGAELGFCVDSVLHCVPARLDVPAGLPPRFGDRGNFGRRCGSASPPLRSLGFFVRSRAMRLALASCFVFVVLVSLFLFRGSSSMPGGGLCIYPVGGILLATKVVELLLKWSAGTIGLAMIVAVQS
ncbi:hypothetical protein NL676_026579 [Syzygium grande]|nr:hypothetical protein NL676_026579 [Syzygium grande]